MTMLSERHEGHIHEGEIHEDDIHEGRHGTSELLPDVHYNLALWGC